MKLTLSALALCTALLSGQTRDKGFAAAGWHFEKVDPLSKKPVLSIEAKSFSMTHDAGIIALHGVTVRRYQTGGIAHQDIKSVDALFDEKQATLTYGPGLKQTVRLK